MKSIPVFAALGVDSTREATSEFFTRGTVVCLLWNPAGRQLEAVRACIYNRASGSGPHSHSPEDLRHALVACDESIRVACFKFEPHDIDQLLIDKLCHPVPSLAHKFNLRSSVLTVQQS